MSKTPQKSRKFMLSGILYRPGKDIAPIPLGAVIEFTTPKTWVVAAVIRHIIDPASLSGLSQLSRELIDARVDVIQGEMDDAMTAAREPGDVLKALAARNEWSFNVTTPHEFVVPSRAGDARKTSDQLAEEYAVIGYARVIAPVSARLREEQAPKTKRPTIRMSEPVMALPPETPPPWMVKSRVYQVPLTGRSHSAARRGRLAA